MWLLVPGNPSAPRVLGLFQWKNPGIILETEKMPQSFQGTSRLVRIQLTCSVMASAPPTALATEQTMIDRFHVHSTWRISVTHTCVYTCGPRRFRNVCFYSTWSSGWRGQIAENFFEVRIASIWLAHNLGIQTAGISSAHILAFSWASWPQARNQRVIPEHPCLHIQPLPQPSWFDHLSIPRHGHSSPSCHWAPV